MSRLNLAPLPFLLILVLACSSAGAAGEAARMKVILDTDIGDDIDDAWALGFLISYQGFAPLGVTRT